MKLTNKQIAMLRAAKESDSPFGYSPCGRGFAATMASLVRLGMAFPTGRAAAMGDLWFPRDIRGVLITTAGVAALAKAEGRA